MAIPPTTGTRKRVIVADDHQTVLATVKQILQPDFAVVATAHDGNTLLREVTRLVPEVVVLDIAMPGLNGLEVARILKGESPHSKLVFLTVHDDEDFVREALAAGASGYVIKARMGADLARAIREALAGRCFISAGIVAKQAGSENHSVRQ